MPVSGRPLDPKRDFGEHTISDVMADVYLANARLAADPNGAEKAYKAAVEEGGAAAAMGYEGLAALAQLRKQSPRLPLSEAIRAGSKSAPVYVAAAEGAAPAEELTLLKNCGASEPALGRAGLSAG